MRWFSPRKSRAASGPLSFISTCVMPPLLVLPMEFLSMMPISSSPSRIITSVSIAFSRSLLSLLYDVENRFRLMSFYASF